MLGLPASVECFKQLPKKAIYAKFKMNTAAKAKFDADISRINIIAEISPITTTLKAGQAVSSIYVLSVLLKKKDFDKQTLIKLTKLIPQNMLFLLECDGQQKLAVYHSKLMETEWVKADELKIALTGLDLDAVWENLIMDIGGISLENSNTLDEQIATDEQRAKLQKEIARLEKQARTESQPRKKFEIVQEINALKRKLI